MIKVYYRLTKPGIIYGNLLAVMAGFFFASKNHGNIWLLLATLLGTSLVMASACVCNNYIDRDIDKKMARTKKRALATGVISNRNALLYALLLGIMGLLVLYVATNLLTVGVALVGFIDYVILYGIAKRRSLYGTLVGSISGATPPVAGYTAVTNQFDMSALLLFLILVCWQMVHFYAIAVYRIHDYAAASIPVLPIKKGMQETKLQMIFYIVAFLIASASLTFLGYTGYLYLVAMILLSSIWFWLAIQGFRTTDDTEWARKMFRYSLIVLLVWCVTVSAGIALP